MALYFVLNRSLCRCTLKTISSNLVKQYTRNIHPRTVSFDIDALDDFTSQLIQRKVDKWNAQKSVYTANSSNINIKEKSSDHDIGQLSIEKVNVLFQELIGIGDNSAILDITSQCIRYQKCPSLSNIIFVLALCAQNGDKYTIVKIQKLCEDFTSEVLKANSYFRHYLAEAIWVRGNIPEALKIFQDIYKENAFLRRRIRLIFKYLMSDVVSNRSEAALISIVKFAEDLLEEFKDFFPLTCIWQSCFLSEWFTDQCLALELLEKHDGLCKAVISRISYVVSVSLNSHRTEAVYRLLEILLKYKMKTQYGGVLLALLDYQIHQRDLCSCIEIIQWSVKNDIELPSFYHGKFINLLLKNNVEVSHYKEKAILLKKGKVATSYKF